MSRPRGTLKENPPPGMMVSIDGRTHIAEPGHAICGQCGGCPIVKRDGVPIGVYIDDTTPNRRKWVSIALLHHPPPQMVFVGIGPDEMRDTLEGEDLGIPHVSPPQLIRLQEWLGWGNAFGPGEPIMPWREFLPVRDCHPGNGYIQQWGWEGYYGHHPPNKTCRETVGRQMRKHKPRFTFKLM